MTIQSLPLESSSYPVESSVTYCRLKVILFILFFFFILIFILTKNVQPQFEDYAHVCEKLQSVHVLQQIDCGVNGW